VSKWLRRFTWHHISEDGILHGHRRENLKSCNLGNFLQKARVLLKLHRSLINHFIFGFNIFILRGSTQPLLVMRTRNLPGCKGRSVRKADNLTATCEATV
jgi:hypothetical protein